jgi:hypothetical protein
MRSWSTTSLSCQTWARQELRLVHQHAAHRAVGGQVLFHPVLQVGVTVEGHAVGAQADPRGHHAGAGAIIQARGQDRHPHAALAVVVRALQQGGGLAGVHRRIVEVELGHRPILVATGPPSRTAPASDLDAGASAGRQ